MSMFKPIIVRAPRVRIWAAAVATSLLLAHEGRAQYVHPGPPPTEKDFVDKPAVQEGLVWSRPSIRTAYVRCWYAEPSDPNKLIGGTDELQSIDIIIPTEELPQDQLATDYLQSDLGHLAGGGMQPVMKLGDVPPGVFVSVKAHPVFNIKKVEYPYMGHDPPLFGPMRQGVHVVGEFLHRAGMGECYFSVAVWVAWKAK